MAATKKQAELIRALDAKLGYDSEDRDFDKMTVAEASSIIDELKDEWEG